MPAPTLQQIETETQIVRGLHLAAWSDLRDAFVSPKVYELLSNDSRRAIIAAVEGYDRELAALATVEREILGNGKTSRPARSASPSDAGGRTESRFDASQAETAALTPVAPPDAETAPREAPRSDASAAPLPPSGKVF